MRAKGFFLGVGLLLAASALSASATAAGVVDNAALGNETDGRNWPAYGRTFSETHYSPLAEINAGHGGPRLRLAWTLDLEASRTTCRRRSRSMASSMSRGPQHRARR